ncbi:acyl carrier protein [Paenibacillus sp. FSL H3-0457]|uniref:acyl carrier protein n=1 Tax=Paenibacillus sp. FSL H3-0457 TaxID=2921430 RepID=UPI0030EC9F3C
MKQSTQNQNEIHKTVIRLIQEILNHNLEILNDEDLDSIGLDSLKAINLIVQLEETYEIEFDDEELIFENFSNINVITEQITNKLSLKEI